MTRKTMASATTVFRNLKQHAERIKNDEPQRVETCSPGDAWPQGDVLLVNLNAVPRGATLVIGELQLAPGDTQGSRHCLDSLEGIAFYRIADPTPLDGPILKADREFTVTHPEHGDITLPAGVWGVVYQRAYADEIRRVAD